MNAVAGWSGAPRPVAARELLPERALLGDAIGDRRAGHGGHAPARRRGPCARRDTGRLSGLGRGDRGVRTRIVRSSKHRPLPPQTDRGLHRTRSDHAARRLRSAGGLDRRSAPSADAVREHDKCRCGPANSVDRTARRRVTAARQVAARYRCSRITCRFVEIPQKHKTRFIISYTAQNRLHSVLLIMCPTHPRLRCLLPDRVRKLPACSRRGSNCPAPPSASLRGREISGLDLARLGTTATAEEITDTAGHPAPGRGRHAARTPGTDKRGLLADADTVVAGHSVGEIAAYAIAGVISADDAVALAATRGAEMAKACAVEPTGMAAVLGGDEAEVLARLEALDLVPANRNAAGQIVAAGALVGAGQARRGSARQGPGPPAGHRRRLPHPLHGLRAGRLRRRGRGRHRQPSRPPPCCPTPTASR